jgi:hypothetical protein
LKAKLDSLLQVSLNEGILKLPQDRRFRKQLYRKVVPKMGLELAVSISSNARLPPPGIDWEFLEYLLEKSDNEEEYVPLGALLEFQLMHGIRDILSLRERIERCSLHLSCRYRNGGTLSVGSFSTIIHHRLTKDEPPPQESDFAEFFNEYFGVVGQYANVGDRKGVWVDRETITALLEAQKITPEYESEPMKQNAGPAFSHPIHTHVRDKIRATSPMKIPRPKPGE